MTRREWQILVALIVVAALAVVLGALALTWAIDTATESQRPDTPILNASAAR